MGLFAFHDLRVGFWMADSPGGAEAEVPPGSRLELTGVPVEGGQSLIVSAGTPEGVPVWSRIIHAKLGAALICPWRDLLLTGLGETALFLDGEGRERGRAETNGDELIAAWPLDEGLLLLARESALLVGEDLQTRWTTKLGGNVRSEGLLFMDATGGRAKLAAMGGDEWREVVIDLATGALVED